MNVGFPESRARTHAGCRDYSAALGQPIRKPIHSAGELDPACIDKNGAVSNNPVRQDDLAAADKES